MSEGDFQTLLHELTDAKNSLVEQNGYMPRQWVFGLIPRVPVHMLEENPDLPNLNPDGRFRKIAEMRHKCRMAAIETEAKCENQKEFDCTIETHARKLWARRSCVLLASRDWCASSPKVIGWDQFGSSELKEGMFGCRIVRQLSSVQRSSFVWHQPQSERCKRC